MTEGLAIKINMSKKIIPVFYNELVFIWTSAYIYHLLTIAKNSGV